MTGSAAERSLRQQVHTPWQWRRSAGRRTDVLGRVGALRSRCADTLTAMMLQLAGVADLPRRSDWRLRAACAHVDPELFYPPKGGTSRPAIRVCAACPVRADCLRSAIEHAEPYGIWGGATANQRRVLRRRARRVLNRSPS